MNEEIGKNRPKGLKIEDESIFSEFIKYSD